MGRKARISREQTLAAARAVFAERGFSGATLADIAARLAVSPAALLRHAPTKAALFAAAMAAPPETAPLPVDFLAAVPGGADPRVVLRRLAREFIPFVEARMGENIAQWMYRKNAGATLTLKLPFDPRGKSAPPQRGFAAVAAYFSRAVKAGRIEAGNPRAAALLFLGSLHSYVFFHRVLQNVHPPVRLDDYLDTLLDVWCRGAIRPGRSPRVKS
jgi:AcrR family transcriptional regulator